MTDLNEYKLNIKEPVDLKEKIQQIVARRKGQRLDFIGKRSYYLVTSLDENNEETAESVRFNIKYESSEKKQFILSTIKQRGCPHTNYKLE